MLSPCRVMCEVRFVRPGHHQMDQPTRRKIDGKSIRAPMRQTKGKSGVAAFPPSLEISYVRLASKRFDRLMMWRAGNAQFGANRAVFDHADQEACSSQYWFVIESDRKPTCRGC